MVTRSIGRTLGNLVLALLNATLILLALCLWLAWSVTSSVEEVTGNLAEVTGSIIPVRSEIRDLTDQIRETREGIASLREGGGPDLHVCTELEAQVAKAEARLAELNVTLHGIEAGIGPAVETAVGTAFGEFGRGFASGLMGAIGFSVPAESPSQ
ncbi:hypothetical protein [Pseudooceanicola nanhaiensis]|uniref:hypothetical protein n=1 Tax=Pseudooceanicola nanhaiensis TaxID=375761 RepID=UPI001CD53D30|nr:hypothetical protein [Pseudooceanicola nanhaiensis]MCA0922589.1 hypothetical protein [Pseudooceanicola nanhaiensis]